MKARALSIVGAALAVLVMQAQAYARAEESNGALGASVLAPSAGGVQPSGPGAVIQVADPTGDPTTDRANIEAAIARARPGDTVLFAKGTYVIGLPPPSPNIQVTVPDVTLLGSVDGTTIRGGATPEDFSQLGFSLAGGGDSVRRLTFQSFTEVIGIFDGLEGNDFGGYTIADNVFKNVLTPIFVFLHSSNPTRITHNQFINVGTAFTIVGRVVYVTDNTNRTRASDAVPVIHRILNAGSLVGIEGLDCNDNVIANNTVEGNVDGFGMATVGGAARRNVIRNNIVTINQAILQPGDTGTLVGLFNIFGGPLDNNLVEGNFLDGTRGFGIPVFRVSNSRFIANVVRGAHRSPDQPASGVAILLDGDSHGNALAGNRLDHNEFCDVWLQLDTHNNLVVEPNDTVLDDGRHNQVIHPQSCDVDSTELQAAASQARSAMIAKTRMMLEEVKRMREAHGDTL